MFHFPARRPILIGGLLAVTIGMGAAAPQATATGDVPRLTCPAAGASGVWQLIPVKPFPSVENVATVDELAAVAVDAALPQRILATNGTTLSSSYSHGCAWQDVLTLEAVPSLELPLSGVTAQVVAVTAMPAGRAVLAVREGTGTAARPHVVTGVDLEPGSFRLSDDGLPDQGTPTLLIAAADGRTVYLVIEPASAAGEAFPLDPALPTPLTRAVYASADAGSSWSRRTASNDLLGVATAFEQLAVDGANPSRLYGIADGQVVVSDDGARHFTPLPLPGTASALTPLGKGGLAVFTTDGYVFFSTDGGRSFTRSRTISHVTSAAGREGDTRVAVEAYGALWLVNPQSGQVMPAPAAHPARARTLTGDRAPAATFHAVSGHALLRYAGHSGRTPTAAPSDALEPVVVGDLGKPTPPTGTVRPATAEVTLPVGSTSEIAFTLAVPRSPTPLDLFFLVDTSVSMSGFIEELKADIGQITAGIAATGIDLHVGVGTVGTGPQDGEPPYPPADPAYDAAHPQGPSYRTPELYTLLRRIGPVDARLADAVGRIQTETTPTTAGATAAEGQLIALQQLLTGTGVPINDGDGPATAYAVDPGQQAGFRPAPSSRRVVVHATDEAFANPTGTPRRNGSPDTHGVAQQLKDAGVLQLGLSVGSQASIPDLADVARVSGAIAPPGGARCGRDGGALPEGAPLICSTSSGFARVIVNLVTGVTDQQRLAITPRNSNGGVARIDAPDLRTLDLRTAHTIAFTATASCVDLTPGSYAAPIDATLGTRRIASALVTVTCVPPAVTAPPAREQSIVAQPVQPAPGAVAAFAPAPAPPPPAANAQPNPQAQSQLQPLTAPALRQQEQAQAALALALADTTGEQDVAMADRHNRGEPGAGRLPITALAVASAFAFAKLRADERVTRA